MTIDDPVLDLLGVQVLASAGRSLEEILTDATGEQLRQLMQATEAVSAAAEREVLRRNTEDSLALPPRPGWHVGAAGSGAGPEDDCPCPKAACGLVELDHLAADCQIHGMDQTIRQGHRADYYLGRRAAEQGAVCKCPTQCEHQGDQRG